ncbi:MAG: hypothetical protein CIT01_06220 [Methanobacterium sp. BRmetb2]|nr:MAG: hypothetical protein CIT01_06220 [Methanobacterium sp. BRmetb2]
MQKGLLYIIIGILFTAIGLLNYINTVLLTAGIIFLISGLFMYANYKNKNLYVGSTALLLIAMSILTYLQLSNPAYRGDVLFNGIFFVLIVIVGIYVIYKFPKDWKL